MKIITWNCNGAFRRKLAYLAQFNADILIIQECEDPAQSKDVAYRDWAKNYIWVGNSKNRGLGVFAQDSSALEELKFDHSFGEQRLKWFIPFQYRNFDIIAIWTQSTANGEFRYIGQLYKFLLNNYNQINHHIFIGDFNSNKVWDYKRSEGDHSTCVRLLKNKNILSLYHEYMNESQGEELMPTFYLHRNITKQYHIDYAFIPNSLLADASLSVGNHDEWLEISDHMPLVIEISQYPPLLTR